MGRSTDSARWVAVAVAVVAVGGLLSGPGGLPAQARSPDSNSQWTPTSAVVQPGDYAGRQVCAECHSAIYARQITTAMGKDAMRPAESSILHEHPALSFVEGPYTYSMSNEGGQYYYRFSDSQGKITAPVVLVFGAGVNHQNYLVQHNDHYHLARVAFYSTTGKLERWSSVPLAVPESLEAALGALAPPQRIRGCFHCHAPTGVVGDGFEIDRASSGIECETCHGPGAKHVAAMRAGKLQNTLIVNPARLNSDEEMDFCGACHSNQKQHGTTVQSVKNGDLRGLGVASVASEPYRLVSSRCWNSADARSRCTFCHDPHQQVAHNAAAYDAKCLACHASTTSAIAKSNQPGKACPVGKQDCTSCHMPQIDVPGTRASRTDHRIRIVRAGEPFPE